MFVREKVIKPNPAMRPDLVRRNLASVHQSNKMRPRDIQDFGGLSSSQLMMDREHRDSVAMSHLLCDSLEYAIDGYGQRHHFAGLTQQARICGHGLSRHEVK